MKRSARLTNHTEAIGYIRVSTAEQVDGVSLEAQRAKIEAWCELNDATLLKVFADEGISGFKSSNRPAFQQAMEMACEHGCVLVVYSITRFARNTKETLALSERLDEAGADLVSLSEKIDTTSAAGKMIFRMLAVLAEFERDQIAERVQGAMDHKRSKGQRLGELPYGFMVADDSKTLIPNPSEQRVMDTIYHWRATGMSIRGIVKAAEEAGMVSRAGKPFCKASIENILKQEVAA